MSQSASGGSLIGKIGSYLQIVTKDPRSTAFVPLAEAYRQIGLLDDALEAAQLGTRMLPHFCPGFATMGRILGQMGRIDEAMSAYARALSIDRQSQAALVGLARLHLIRAERDQAKKILNQAAEFHPDDETIKNMLTALELPRPWAEIQSAPEVQEAQNTEAPAEAVRTEDSAEKGTPIPTATLAEIYVKQGLFDKAIEVYEGILQINPDNAQAQERLAQLRSEIDADATEPEFERTSPEADADTATLTSPEADQPQSTAFVEDPAEIKDHSPLAIFERWLAAIKQGKIHV